VPHDLSSVTLIISINWTRAVYRRPWARKFKCLGIRD